MLNQHSQRQINLKIWEESTSTAIIDPYYLAML